jgi:uncharacterized repeat protein (TIGR01451 family)
MALHAMPRRPHGPIAALGRWLLLWLALLGWAGVASAQTQFTFSNTTSGTVDETATPCNNPLVRTFAVAQSFNLSDVNIGVVIAHSYRGDLVMTLQSPTGTRVTVNSGVGVAADNFNVLMDDAAASPLSGHAADDTATSSASAPPYQRLFSPTGLLSNFNGQNVNGTWRLEICDQFNADTGTFYRADLYLTQPPTVYADLSLTKLVSNGTPANGASITYTLTIANAAGSPSTASGVTVEDLLPAGFAYTSHVAGGGSTFTPGTGLWSVGTLAPGATRTLTITGTVTATSGATVTNGAQVTASSAADIDSTVGNGINSEDDSATVSFTVSGARVAGTPPTLACPIGTTLHDWDGVTWAAGTTNASYPVANLGSVTFAIAISGGVFLNNGSFGGQSPTRQNVVTGGFSPAQFSIAQLVNMTSQAGMVTTTVTLPSGVEGAQFRLFDVDFGNNQFADRATVTGTFGGAPVTPVLTNGIANYVIGNSAFGDATSADTSANGTVVVTFSDPVDTIIIEYGNHALAPNNPGQQAIAIHDFTLCRPVANLAVTKISSVVSDPVNGVTDPKAIPGAVVQYCITITNPDSGTARGIAIADALPPATSFVSGSIRSGSSCGSAATPEDDNAAGADESDPDGASISGSTISASSDAIGPNSTRAFTFQVTVN